MFDNCAMKMTTQGIRGGSDTSSFTVLAARKSADQMQAKPGRDEMVDDDVRTLMAQGLHAFKAGGEVAQAAINEIHQDASDPELLAELQASNKTSEGWAQRVERATREVGFTGEPGEDGDNLIVQAHFETSRRLRRKAPDDLSRDLGIIAMHQVALHYWIAAFGTLRTYAQSVGMSQTVQDMQACLDEAREADQQSTDRAITLLAARG